MENNSFTDKFFSLIDYPIRPFNLNEFYGTVPRSNRDSFFYIMVDILKDFNELYFMETNHFIDSFFSQKGDPDRFIFLDGYYSSVPRKQRNSFFPFMVSIIQDYNKIVCKNIEVKEKKRWKNKLAYQMKKEAGKQYELEHQEEIEKERYERMICLRNEKSEAENRLKMLHYDDLEEYISLCNKYRFDNKDYMMCKSHLYKKYKGRKREIDKILIHFNENKWFVECKTQHVKNIYYNLYPGLIIDQLLNDVNDPTKLVNDIWGLANIY